ncbi:MAG: Rpn family recombination-promoting nuclease/putative transposase [Ruminococcus sp.]|jgi:hypothetical protein|nr:Rpn family recombination-promoting nuclease/putative transposase [Ruminococcus sp.]
MTDDERWAVFIEYVNDNRFKEKAHEFETREGFKEAMETLSRVTQADRDYNYLMSRDKYERDMAQDIHDAEERGRMETLIEMVKESFKIGLNIDAISKLTKLPPSKIEELRG